jgi:hypothetical protein
MGDHHSDATLASSRRTFVKAGTLVSAGLVPGAAAADATKPAEEDEEGRDLDAAMRHYQFEPETRVRVLSSDLQWQPGDVRGRGRPYQTNVVEYVPGRSYRTFLFTAPEALAEGTEYRLSEPDEGAVTGPLAAVALDPVD